MKHILLFSFLLICTMPIIGQENGQLIVEVKAKNSKQKGKVVVMLFDQSEGFPKEIEKAYKTLTIDNFPGTSTVTFTEVPFGKYAISIFWDKNKNGKIDTNFVGFPKESIGASNMSSLGKPSFNKSAFQFKNDQQKLVVKFLN
ncbi:MAG: DUF2141 domain-containing protein [Crocinitomicaceae bacterium]|nr:DUF2141 domain-containing protein [Crocinitomicaceae bacterium]